MRRRTTIQPTLHEISILDVPRGCSYAADANGVKGHIGDFRLPFDRGHLGSFPVALLFREQASRPAQDHAQLRAPRRIYLASVSATKGAELKARRLAGVRRRRALMALTVGALASLALAVLQGSFLWLATTIAFDIALAGYITVLLQIRATRARSAPVVSLVPEEIPDDAQHHTVRVVAG